MADIKVISRELVILATFRPGEAPDTGNPYNSVTIRPEQAVFRMVDDSDGLRLRNAVLTGPRIGRNGNLGMPHDITFYPGTLPTWLEIVASEAKELANG